MNSFLVATRVVLPMAMMMGVGVIMRLTGITDRDTMKKVDKIIFNVLMSVLMFYNIYNTDLRELANAGYIAYGVTGILVLFAIAILVIPRFVKPAPTAAALGQAILRGNYILFGAAVAQNLYGEGNVGIMMLMGAIVVPMFNILATIILEFGRSDKTKPSKLILSVMKNPNVVGAFAGIVTNLLCIRVPDLVMGVVSDIGGLASPLSFLSLGVSLDIAAVKRKGKLLAAGLTMRLMIIPAVMLTGAYLLGFAGQQMCSLMLLFAAPVAVSSYPMAVAMDADGELAGQMVAFSTLLSLVTIFGWTALLSSLGLL